MRARVEARQYGYVVILRAGNLRWSYPFPAELFGGRRASLRAAKRFVRKQRWDIYE